MAEETSAFMAKTKRPLTAIYLCMLVMATVYVITSFLFCDLTIRNGVSSANAIVLTPTNVYQLSDDVYSFDLEIPNAQNSCYAVQFMTTHSDVVVTDNHGTTLYTMKAVPSIYGKSSGSKVNFVRIPYGMTKIHVEITGTFRNAGLDNTTFYYGDGITMLEKIVRGSAPSAAVSLLIMTFGLALLGYWVITRRKMQTGPTVAYFGTLTLLLGLWALNETDLMMVMMENRTIGSMLGFVLLMLIPIPVLGFSKYFYQSKDKYAWSIFAGISLISFVALMILHISGILVFKESVYVVHANLIMALGYMVYSLVDRIIRKGMDRRNIANMIALLILIASAALDMIGYYMGNQQTDVWGKLGLLIYIGILTGETLADAMAQVEQGRKAELYKEMAVTDVMTGLYNRSAYEEWEENCKESYGILIAIFDLNDLKWHNDTLGHAAGDEYIIAAAHMIRDIFGIQGKCYRIGGDEFCVIVRHGEKFDMEAKLAKLRASEAAFNAGASQVRIQIACGYAICLDNAESIAEIRARADEMMYENKKKMKETE